MSAEACKIFYQVQNQWTLTACLDLEGYCAEDPEVRDLATHKKQAETWAVKERKKLGLQAPKGQALAKILQAVAEVDRAKRSVA